MESLARPDIDHRRGQHGAVDDARVVVQIAQRAMSAHGMSQYEVGRRRFRPHDGFDEEMQVDQIVVEAPDMAFVTVREGPAGQALTAPVHGVNGEIPVQEIENRLDMFFDELAPSRQQDDRAARLPLGTISGAIIRPKRIADPRAVAGIEKSVSAPWRQGPKRADIGRHQSGFPGLARTGSGAADKTFQYGANRARTPPPGLMGRRRRGTL